MNANIPPQKGMIQRWLRFGIKWGTLLIVLFAILIFGSLWYLGHQGLPDFAKLKIPPMQRGLFKLNTSHHPKARFFLANVHYQPR